MDWYNNASYSVWDGEEKRSKARALVMRMEDEKSYCKKKVNKYGAHKKIKKIWRTQRNDNTHTTRTRHNALEVLKNSENVKKNTWDRPCHNEVIVSKEEIDTETT